jgi:M6 family metalloprotease-like protein
MKHILTILIILATSLTTYAVVANRTPATITQPDGSALEITLHGDEYMSWNTTSDGYTIMRTDDGFMKYVVADGNTLITSEVVAHNPDNRSTSERTFLANIDSHAIAALHSSASAKARHMRSLPQLSASERYDYTKFRGLVILVEFNDCKFSRTDIAEIFTDMISKRGYTGFTDTDGTPLEYTGSVRDYFYDNSMHLFDPQFDVVGPVTVDYSQLYPCGTDNAHAIVGDALRAADTLVDYSNYDTDGDGTVEMVYLIFAGAGANFSGNDSRYIWPHASKLTTVSLDGVKFNRYACSTEYYGRESDHTIDGIGTICHEFSHVLGLEDLYDTDYSTNGQSVSPEDWSLMASGSYLNDARTPCCLSLYERYAIGFATPQLIEETGSFNITAIDKSNTGYRINSGMDNEYFLIENRQNSGWDKYLPGHGMLVFRVDSTDTSMWTRNKVNAYADHNYYELLRANPVFNEKGYIIDSQSDPFPGSSVVTEITNVSSPRLRSWTGLETDFIITNIAETDDGSITFNVDADEPDCSFENFEECPETSSATTVTGKFCTWTLDGGAQISTYTSTDTGNRSVAMVRGASITSGTIEKPVDFIIADIYNPTNYTTAIKCQYSADNGATWETVNLINGDSDVRPEAKSNVHVIFKTGTPAGCIYRFSEDVGNRTSYIDNVWMYFTRTATSAISSVVADYANGTLTVARNGNNIAVSTTNHEPITLYSSAGVKLASSRVVDNGALFTLTCHGIYIVSQGTQSVKILF